MLKKINFKFYNYETALLFMVIVLMTIGLISFKPQSKEYRFINSI